MALILTIEDGSGVRNAGSYATLDQIRTYNAQRVVTLPQADDDVIKLASAAMDYLGIFEKQWSGSRTYGFAQRFAWPRKNVTVFGMAMPSDMVPPDIVDAQCYLVGIAEDIDLYGNKDSYAVIQDTIGPLTTKFSPTQGAIGGPILPTLMAMLTPYFSSGVGPLRSVRV